MSDKLQEARTEVAKLTGIINRTCGNLGLDPGPEHLETWNSERDRKASESVVTRMDLTSHGD